MRDLFWLSDEAWAALEPHLPHNQPGKPRVDDRRVISGILHILKTDGRRRDGVVTLTAAKCIKADLVAGQAQAAMLAADFHSAMALRRCRWMAEAKRLERDGTKRLRTAENTRQRTR
jgi:transposase